MTQSDATKSFIAKYFNGDEKAFNDVMRVENPEAYAHYRKYYQTTVHWRDIDLHIKCHPEYHELSLAWIRYLLGYIPQPEAYMPFLAFIQSLVQSEQTGKISEDKFMEELLPCVQQIRNKDIKHGGWLLDFTHEPHHYQRYYSHLAPYQQASRERHCRFLGYEPHLNYSLEAEIFLRQIFAEDYFHTDMSYCNVDYQAATITRYREAFLTEGEEAADASDLIKPSV